MEYDVEKGEMDGGSCMWRIKRMVDGEMVVEGELEAVYQQRWEFESSLAEIETRQRGSYSVLSSLLDRLRPPGSQLPRPPWPRPVP